MIAALAAGIIARPRARTALRWSVVALDVLLFLLSLQRAGERAGRMAERLETMEKPMRFTVGCSRPRLAGLVVVTGSLAGCATAGSERPIAVCPPVVEYSSEFQTRAAGELVLLRDQSAVAEMLSDYAVMREQARVC